jgi:hypothetical protein
MTLLECLRRAREAYIRGEHRPYGTLDLEPLVLAAAGGDAALTQRALALLNKCTPGYFENRETDDKLIRSCERAGDAQALSFIRRYGMRASSRRTPSGTSSTTPSRAPSRPGGWYAPRATRWQRCSGKAAW